MYCVCNLSFCNNVCLHAPDDRLQQLRQPSDLRNLQPQRPQDMRTQIREQYSAQNKYVKSIQDVIQKKLFLETLINTPQ